MYEGKPKYISHQFMHKVHLTYSNTCFLMFMNKLKEQFFFRKGDARKSDV